MAPPNARYPGTLSGSEEARTEGLDSGLREEAGDWILGLREEE